MYDVWAVWLMYDVWDVWDVWDVCAVCPYIGVRPCVNAVWAPIQRESCMRRCMVYVPRPGCEEDCEHGVQTTMGGLRLCWGVLGSMPKAGGHMVSRSSHPSSHRRCAARCMCGCMEFCMYALYGRPYSAYMQNSIQPHIQRAAHLRCEEGCEDLETI